MLDTVVMTLIGYGLWFTTGLLFYYVNVRLSHKTMVFLKREPDWPTMTLEVHLWPVVALRVAMLAVHLTAYYATRDNIANEVLVQTAQEGLRVNEALFNHD